MSVKILITGGTGLLGSELVKYFYIKNYEVVFISRNKEKSLKLIKSLPVHSAKILPKYISMDLCEKNSVHRCLTYLRNKNFWPDILINNARNRDFLKNQKNNLPDRISFVNEYLLDAVVPYELSINIAENKKSKLRKIVNVSSIYGVVAPRPGLYKNPGRDSPVHYSIAKAAQIHMTKELASRLANKNITVNAVAAGGFKDGVPKSFMKKYSSNCPQGKMLDKSEVVKAIEFLCSENSSAVTGHTLMADGGWTIW